MAPPPPAKLEVEQKSPCHWALQGSHACLFKNLAWPFKCFAAYLGKEVIIVSPNL